MTPNERRRPGRPRKPPNIQHRPSEVGARVRRLREMTRRDDALGPLLPRHVDALLGMPEGRVYLIEEGYRREPKATTLIQLARFFGVSVQFLAIGEGPDPDPDVVRAAVARWTPTQ